MTGQRGETEAWGEGTQTGPHEYFSASPKEHISGGLVEFVFSISEGELTGSG